MKISRWPSNTIEFFKEPDGLIVPILLIFAVVGTAIFIAVQSGINERRIQEKYPIGKHVAIKGTNLQGTISKVNGCGCDIEVMIVTNGKIEKVSVDKKLIE